LEKIAALHLIDGVAEKDPAEALKLSLALLRFVTPTLQAAAIADITPPKHPRDCS
jgi:hypothetical protein